MFAFDVVPGTGITLAADDTTRVGNIMQHISASFSVESKIVNITLSYIRTWSKSGEGGYFAIGRTMTRIQYYIDWWKMDENKHVLMSAFSSKELDFSPIRGRFIALMGDRASPNIKMYQIMMNEFENIDSRIWCTRHDLNNACISLLKFLKEFCAWISLCFFFIFFCVK